MDRKGLYFENGKPANHVCSRKWGLSFEDPTDNPWPERCLRGGRQDSDGREEEGKARGSVSPDRMIGWRVRTIPKCLCDNRHSEGACQTLSPGTVSSGEGTGARQTRCVACGSMSRAGAETTAPHVSRRKGLNGVGTGEGQEGHPKENPPLRFDSRGTQMVWLGESFGSEGSGDGAGSREPPNADSSPVLLRSGAERQTPRRVFSSGVATPLSVARSLGSRVSGDGAMRADHRLGVSGPSWRASTTPRRTPTTGGDTVRPGVCFSLKVPEKVVSKTVDRCGTYGDQTPHLCGDARGVCARAVKVCGLPTGTGRWGLGLCHHAGCVRRCDSVRCSAVNPARGEWFVRRWCCRRAGLS